MFPAARIGRLLGGLPTQSTLCCLLVIKPMATGLDATSYWFDQDAYWLVLSEHDGVSLI